MRIYQHRATLTASGGSNNTLSLAVVGGLCRHVLVSANTATTVFGVDVVDPNSVTVLNYPYHQGEINDWDITLPMSGRYTLNITNSSPNDTFSVLLSIQE